VDLTLEQLMEDEEEPWQKQLKRLERDPASPPSRRTRSQKKEEEKREKMNNVSLLTTNSLLSHILICNTSL
jgi:hypothetical protein